MARLIIILAVGILAIIAWKKIAAMPTGQRQKRLLQGGLTALAVILLLLVATGRLPLIGAVAAAMIPLIKRLLPALVRFLPLLAQWLRPSLSRRDNQASGRSTVNTDLLSMWLDHQSGEIGGKVCAGPHAGRELDQLSDGELLAMFQDCEHRDEQSAQLLASYLDQRLGSNWRQNRQNNHGQYAASSNMSREEALAILGVEDGTSIDQILAAHRRLIQKLHPDRGGNDYLAGQLNRARDVLLS